MKKSLLYKVCLGIVCLLISCNNQKEERYTDEHGNIFIEKGKKLSIIPAKYKKTGETYKIFIYNETDNKIGITESIKIEPNEFIVTNLVDTSVLKLSNGVEFKFGESYGLETIDKEKQVSGLGGKYLKKYKVPDEVEWAFVIVPKGEGDYKTRHKLSYVEQCPQKVALLHTFTVTFKKNINNGKIRDRKKPRIFRICL